MTARPSHLRLVPWTDANDLRGDALGRGELPRPRIATVPDEGDGRARLLFDAAQAVLPVGRYPVTDAGSAAFEEGGASVAADSTERVSILLLGTEQLGLLEELARIRRANRFVVPGAPPENCVADDPRSTAAVVSSWLAVPCGGLGVACRHEPGPGRRTERGAEGSSNRGRPGELDLGTATDFERNPTPRGSATGTGRDVSPPTAGALREGRGRHPETVPCRLPTDARETAGRVALQERWGAVARWVRDRTTRVLGAPIAKAFGLARRWHAWAGAAPPRVGSSRKCSS